MISFLFMSLLSVSQIIAPISGQSCCNQQLCNVSDHMQCSNDGTKCVCSPGYAILPGTDLCRGEKLLKDLCTDTNQCQPTNSECRKPRLFSQKRCLCKAGYVEIPGFDNCTHVDELKVIKHQVNETSLTSISLFWDFKYRDQFTDTVTFMLSPGTFVYKGFAGTVHNLNPYSSQQTIYIYTRIAADSFYNLIQVYTTLIGYLLPIVPGKFDPGKSLMDDQPMTFVFTSSSSYVYIYELTFTTDTGSFSRPISSSTVTGLNFDYGKTYTYTIKALNRNYERSAATTGNFTISSPSAGEVRSLGVYHQSSEWIELIIQSPLFITQTVIGFVAHLIKDDKCLMAAYITCSDCDDGKIPIYNCEELNSTKVVTTKARLHHDYHRLHFTSLLSYTYYNFDVIAITVNGDGNPRRITTRTRYSAPEDITNLQLSTHLDSSFDVWLVANWTQGRQTAPQTTYSLTLEDIDEKTKVESVVEGYFHDEMKWGQLKSFQNYRVSIYSTTDLGRSKTISNTFTTATKPPAPVQNLKLIRHKDYPKRMTLTFDCPAIFEWHGPSVGFTVIKTINSDYREVYEISAESCSSLMEVKSNTLGDFFIGNNYTFEVMSKNRDYESLENSSVTFQPRTQRPVIDMRVVTDKKPKWMKQSVEIGLCRDCLVESQQGAVTMAGLLVCVKSVTNKCSTNKNRRKRDTDTELDLMAYKTWAQAVGVDFELPYRATPDDWIDELRIEYSGSFVIGKDYTCNSNDGNVYCNGLLPLDRDVVVTPFVCTSIGCQTDMPEEINREDSGPSTPVTCIDSDDGDGVNMIIVIIMAACFVLIILIVIIVAVICVRRERKRQPAQSDVPRSGLDNAAHQEHSIWATKLEEFAQKIAKIQTTDKTAFQTEYSHISPRKSLTRFAPRKLTKKYKIDSQLIGLNANFIPGNQSDRDYIAMGRIPDMTKFWQMIWKQECNVFIQVCWNKNKSEKVNYGPSKLNETLIFGDISVQLTKTIQGKNYKMKEMRITKDNTSREIVCFEPRVKDMSVEDILTFSMQVRIRARSDTRHPMVVQCREGMNKTGTVIALDYFVQFVESSDPNAVIDVFDYVTLMRKHQPGIIDSWEEYSTLNLAVAEAIDRKFVYEDPNGNDGRYERLIVQRGNKTYADKVYMNT